jgi:hypothetical protein
MDLHEVSGDIVRKTEDVTEEASSEYPRIGRSLILKATYDGELHQKRSETDMQYSDMVLKGPPEKESLVSTL